MLKLDEGTAVSYSKANIPFDSVQKNLCQVNKLTTIKSIHERSSIDEYLNVAAHAVLDSNGVQDVMTKFGMKKKREVLLYDDSGSIKLALWNNHIDYLKEDGNYRFKDLRIKSFNGKYLTTTALSMIVEAGDEVSFKEHSEFHHQGSSTSIVKFPSSTIEIFEENFYCKKCSFKGTPSGRLLLCSRCGSKSLFNEDDKKYFVRAAFIDNNDVPVSINIPNAIVNKYLANFPDATTEEEKEIAFLTGTNTTNLTYSLSSLSATDITI